MTDSHSTVTEPDSDPFRLHCCSDDCDEPIDDDDDVVWRNYQQGDVYHRDCFSTPERDLRNLRAGELVTGEELPENEMEPDGKPDWIGDDLIVVVNDGVCVEMQMAFEVTAVYEHGPDEPVQEVLSGGPR